MKSLQLHEYHKNIGAQFRDMRGLQIPSVYTSVEEELNAATNSVVLLDRSYLGKIYAKGKDTVDLLDRISTNDMNQLIMGAACDTVFCTPKGRIVDYAKVLHYEDNLLLISSFMSNNHLIEWINRFVILEDVEIEDCSEQFLWLTLVGPQARRFVEELSGQQVVDQDETIWLHQQGLRFPALKNKNLKMPTYNFCLPVKEGKNIFKWLHTRLKEFGGKIIGDHAFQILRVESGMPDWGTELTEEFNPHEARIIHAVSFTKGCYTGQEVIARLDTYDKVQKYLMIIDLSEPVYAEPPFEVYLDKELIGKLTSYIYNPLNKRSVGLGYIKKNLTVADFHFKVDIIVNGKAVPADLRVPPVRLPGE